MSNWYNSQSWYAPLHEEQTSQANRQTKKRDKGLTPLRITALVIIALVLIAGTSIAFSKGEKPVANAPMIEDDLPENYMEFFDGFYTGVTTETAKVDVPKYNERISFAVETVKADRDEMSLQDLYKNCVDSIVSIKAYSDKDITGYAWGSGVILSEDGLILTNTHVVEGQNKAVVLLGDDTEYEALLVGADSISDLAVLKIDAHGLKAAQFGESNDLVVGDKVAAIGNPLSSDFRLTLTDGIISGIERGMKYNGHVMNLLQTNTAINNGNSGGALFNMYGQVIGITNMKMISSYSSVEGIGFAIPSSTVASVVNSIIQSGKVSGRTSIGITVGAIPPEVAKHYGMPEGIYVSDVIETSDAAKKGVQIGDVITAVNGLPVKETSDVAAIKDKLAVGDSMTLTIWRAGETIDIEVVLMDTNDLY